MGFEIAIRSALISIGILFMLLSVAGAILTLAQGAGRVKTLGAGDNPLQNVTKLMEALSTFLKALISAPLWLALAIVGIAHILLGALLPLPL